MKRLRDLVRLAGHPVLFGAAYMVTLAAWAGRAPAIDARTGGRQVHKLESFVMARFGDEIVRVEVAVVAASLVVGMLLGAAAAAVLAGHDAIRSLGDAGAATEGRAAPAAPREASRGRTELGRAARALFAVVVAHAILELWGMARDPALYAQAWYAQGGTQRTVQVVLTDVVGPTWFLLLALAGVAAYVLGRPSRWGNVARRARAHVTQSAPQVIAILLVALAAPMLARLPAAHATADGRPNVLLLAADSLRADRFGPRTTPHLFDFAARGTRFDRTYVSIPRTFPSWVTFLTGRHAHHHGIRSMFPRWEDRARDFDALPERLARAGYATGVVSDYAGDVFSRIDLGFGRVDVPAFDFRQLVRQQALERETPLMPVLHSRVGRAVFPVMRELNDAADPAMLAQDAISTMRALQRSGRPFFLVVFFSTAHFPYASPAPYYRRFTDADYRGRYKYDKPVGLGDDAPADARDQAQVRALYDGAVQSLDDAAQSILDAVAADAEKRTIVVVTADHGETLYEGGRDTGHGDHLFGDEGTHVPLVVVDPRHPGPHRDGGIARDVDLAPTLYALTGVPAPSDLDGRSLVPALDGQPLPPVEAFAETELWFTQDVPGLPADLRIPYPGIAQLTEVDAAHGDEVVLQKAMGPLTLVARHRMVRDDRWKLIYVPTRTAVRWMLFDTLVDPSETHDVAAAHPEVVARLQGDLWSWMTKDPSMTQRGGYLVPNETKSNDARQPELIRLDDGQTPP